MHARLQDALCWLQLLSAASTANQAEFWLPRFCFVLAAAAASSSIQLQLLAQTQGPTTHPSPRPKPARPSPRPKPARSMLLSSPVKKKKKQIRHRRRPPRAAPRPRLPQPAPSARQHTHARHSYQQDPEGGERQAALRRGRNLTKMATPLALTKLRRPTSPRGAHLAALSGRETK